jgi:RNA polymerase sigma-70 factor, ECF subfamily
MSYEEAAGVAQCAVGTIKSRVNRARTTLTEMLAIPDTDAFGPDAATVATIAREPSLLRGQQNSR